MKRNRFFAIIFIIGFLVMCIPGLTGCNCGCVDRIEMVPYDVKKLRMIDDEDYVYDRLDILKYTIDGQTMTVFYSYRHGIVDIEMSGDTRDPKVEPSEPGDDSSILGSESFFEY